MPHSFCDPQLDKCGEEKTNRSDLVFCQGMIAWTATLWSVAERCLSRSPSHQLLVDSLFQGCRGYNLRLQWESKSSWEFVEQTLPEILLWRAEIGPSTDMANGLPGTSAAGGRTWSHTILNTGILVSLCTLNLLGNKKHCTKRAKGCKCCLLRIPNHRES